MHEYRAVRWLVVDECCVGRGAEPAAAEGKNDACRSMMMMLMVMKEDDDEDEGEGDEDEGGGG